MKNFIVDIGYQRIFVRAKNEEAVREYICKEFPDNANTPILGWCTNEVANEIGFDIYFVDTVPLTIKDLYEWAVENQYEDYALYSFDSNDTIMSHNKFTLNDLTIFRDDQEIFIF